MIAQEKRKAPISGANSFENYSLIFLVATIPATAAIKRAATPKYTMLSPVCGDVDGPDGASGFGSAVGLTSAKAEKENIKNIIIAISIIEIIFFIKTPPNIINDI